MLLNLNLIISRISILYFLIFVFVYILLAYDYRKVRVWSQFEILGNHIIFIAIFLLVDPVFDGSFALLAPVFSGSNLLNVYLFWILLKPYFLLILWTQAQDKIRDLRFNLHALLLRFRLDWIIILVESLAKCLNIHLVLKTVVILLWSKEC